MKKAYLTILLFLGCFIFGQKYEAVITFNDGTTKKGYLDLVQNMSKKGELSFKANNDAKKEKLSVISFKKIEYSDEGKTVLAEPVFISGSIYWMYKIHEGDLVVYANATVDHDNHWSYGNLYTQTTEISYYAFKYKDEPAQIVSMFMDAGPLTVNTFQKKSNEKILIAYFENKCPKLVEAYKNKEFKIKKDPYPFVEYFEKYCK